MRGRGRRRESVFGTAREIDRHVAHAEAAGLSEGRVPWSFESVQLGFRPTPYAPAKRLRAQRTRSAAWPANDVQVVTLDERDERGAAALARVGRRAIPIAERDVGASTAGQVSEKSTRVDRARRPPAGV